MEDWAAQSFSHRILNFDDPLGSSWVGFILLTIIVFGFGAMMMGRALAETWRPAWQNVAYGLLLGVANRLFHYFFIADDPINLPVCPQTAVLIGTALRLPDHARAKDGGTVSVAISTRRPVELAANILN
jgi:hypothetical protein